MIDEKNFKNILGLIENSSLKIQNIKDAVGERRKKTDIQDIEFSSLADSIEEVIAGKDYDDLDKFLGVLSKDIAYRLSFLKEYYGSLDENLLKIHNVAKHIDADSLQDVEDLTDVVDAFLYKIKILQGVIGDIESKLSSFDGSNASSFLKSLMLDCHEFDEEFEEVVSQLKENYKGACDLTRALTSIDAGIEIQEELFSIDVSLNLLMSAISVFDKKYQDIGKAFQESEAYSELQDKINQLAKDTKALSGNLKSFENALEGKSELTEQLDIISGKVDKLKESLPSEYDAEFEAIKAQIVNLDEKIGDFDESLKSFDNSKVESSMDEAKKHILALAKKMDFIGDSLQDGYVNDFNEIKEGIKAFDDKLEAFEFSLKGVQGVDLEEFKGKFFAFDEKIDSLGVSFKELQSAGMEDLQKEIASFGEKINSLDISLQESQNPALAEIKEEILSFDEKIKLLGLSLKGSQEANLEDLKEEMAIFSERISELVDSLQDIQGAGLENINEMIDSFDERIDLVAHSLREAQSQDLEDLKQGVYSFDEKMNSLAGSIKESQSGDIEGLKQSLSLFDEKINAIAGSVKESQVQDLEDLKQGIASFDEKIDSLKQSIEETQSQNLEELKQNLSSFNQEIAALENSIKESQSEDIEDLKQGVYSLGDTVRDAQAHHIESLRGEIASFDEKINTLSNSIKEAQAQGIEELKQSVYSFDDKIESLQYSVTEAQAKDIEELKQKIYSFDKKIGALESSMRESQKQGIEDLKQGIYLFYEKVNAVVDSLNESKIDDIEEFRQSVYSFDEKLGALEHSLVESQDQSLNEIKQDISSFDEKINSLVASIKESQAGDIEELKQGVNSLGDNIKDAQASHIQSLRNEIASFTGEIEGLNFSLRDAQNTGLEGLKTEILSFDRKVEAFSRSIKDAQADGLEEVKREIITFDDKVLGLSNTLRELHHAGLEELKNEIATFDNKIHALGLSLKDAQSDDLEELKNEVFAFDEKIASVALSLQEMQGSGLEDINEKVDALYDKLESVGLILEDTQSNDLEEIKNKINSFDSKFESIDVAIRDFQGAGLEGLIEKIDSFYGKFDAIEYAISNSQTGDFDELKESISAFDIKMESIKESLRVLQGANLEGLDGKLNTLEYSIKDSQEVHFEEVKESISSFDGKIENLGYIINELQGSEDGVDEKLGALEYALKEAQTTGVEEIKESISSFDGKIENLGHIINELQGSEDGLDEKLGALEDALKEAQVTGVEEIKESVLSFNQKIEGMEFSLRDSQNVNSEGIKGQIATLVGKVELINSIVESSGREEFAGLKQNLESIETRISGLSNAKKLIELEDILTEVNSRGLESYEKIDYLHQLVLGIDFGKVEEEIAIVNSDLALLLNEVKKNRTFTHKSFENLQDEIHKINLNEVKDKLNALEAGLRSGFDSTAKNEDMNHFVEGMDYILQKFEMLSGFIDSCDEFFLIKDQFVLLDQKIVDIKKGVDRVEGAADLKKFIGAHQEKVRILVESLNNTEKVVELKQQSDALYSEVIQTKELAENIGNTIEAVGFDEFQEAILDMQNVVSNVKEALILMDEKLENVAQKSDMTALGNLVRESTQNAAQKSDIANLENFISEKAAPLADKTDVTLVNQLIQEKSDQLEYLIRVLDQSDEITEIKQAIVQTNNIVELEKLGQRLEELLANQKEARQLLANLNTKDLERALDIMSAEQRDMKITLEQINEVDFVDEVKNVSNLVEEKFELVDSIKADVASLGVELETLLKPEDMLGTVKNIDDIQFAVKETLSESAMIREDVSALEHKVEELKSMLDYAGHKKDFQDVKGILSHIKDLQDDTKDMFSSVANVDDVAQLGSLINDNYHEIRMAFESLEPSKQADELNRILEGFKKDQSAMSAIISDFEDNIDEKTFSLIRDQLEASENTIKAYIDKIQAKEEVMSIKTQLDLLTKDIAMQLMQVFENISFEQETQEIKDFIEDSEVNMKASIAGLKSSMERLLDAPQPIYIDELKSDMEKLAKGVISLSENVDNIGPEVNEYVSTLDSVRVSLEELATTQNNVKILEQEIGGLNVDIGEVLKLLHGAATYYETFYTTSEAKADFDKVKLTLERILKNQYEQKESHQKEDLKGGIDNVNLSISNIHDSLNHFVSDYQGFAQRVVDTVENLDNVTSHISNIDSINTEYKQGVNESFRLLKQDLESIAAKVNFIGDDLTKVSEVSNQIVEFNSEAKTDIIEDIASVRDVLDRSEIMKVQDGLSNVIFTLTGFINDFEKKYADLQVDSKSILSITEQGKEICENLKGSMVYMAEWVNSSGKTFSNLQESINSFRTSFDEKIQDLRTIEDVKNVLGNLENTLSHQMDATLAKQLKDRIDIDLIPTMQEKIDTSLDEKLTVKFASNEKEREEDRQNLKVMIAKQLGDNLDEEKELLEVIEQKLTNKIQAGVSAIAAKEIDFDPVTEMIEVTAVNMQEKFKSELRGVSKSLGETSKTLNDEVKSQLEPLTLQLQTQLEQMNQDNKEQIDETIAALNSLVETLSVKLKNQDDKIDLIDGKLKDQDRKIDILTGKLDLFMDKVAKTQAIDLGEQVISLESRMGNLNDNIQKIVSFVEED